MYLVCNNFFLIEQITEKKVLQEKYKLLQSQNSHLLITAKSLQQRESVS